MSFLKMFRDWVGPDNQERQRFEEVWKVQTKPLNMTSEWQKYEFELAWQVYTLQKEVELLRMKQQ